MTGAEAGAGCKRRRATIWAGTIALAATLAACQAAPSGALLTAGLVADGKAPPETAPGAIAAADGATTTTKTDAGAAGFADGEEAPLAPAGSGATQVALMPLPDTLPAPRAAVLSRAMRDMLAAQGYRLVPPPRGGASQGVYIVDADIAVERRDTGGEKIGIDWRVSDALGAPVGKISQQAALATGAGEALWRRQAILAAAAAAEGLARLVPRRVPGE